MSIAAIAIIAVSLFLQAFFAGTEMAIISCNKIKLRHKAEMGDKRAKLVQRFLEHPANFLGTTLVGYNVAVIVGSCVLNNIVSGYAPPGYENLLSLAILWPLVLIIGQIVPMASGRQYANRFSLFTVRPLAIAYMILYPVVMSASFLARVISKIVTGKGITKNPFVTRDELELLVRESHESGFLKKEEREMIEEIFVFGETTVIEAMVPLIDVIAAPAEATVGELGRLIAGTGHSRIPIYRDRIDHIVGTASATDLTGIPPDTTVDNVMRAPYIIPETAPLEVVLRDLQQNRKHIAIVVDEYGGVSGIITLEDIIEEIVGEIEDEYDRGEDFDWHKTGESIMVDGKMRIDEFNREFGQRIPDRDAETMAGFVINHLGKVPDKGFEFIYGDLSFRIAEATDRRILEIEIREKSK